MCVLCQRAAKLVGADIASCLANFPFEMVLSDRKASISSSLTWQCRGTSVSYSVVTQICILGKCIGYSLVCPDLYLGKCISYASCTESGSGACLSYFFMYLICLGQTCQWIHLDSFFSCGFLHFDLTHFFSIAV